MYKIQQNVKISSWWYISLEIIVSAYNLLDKTNSDKTLS